MARLTPLAVMGAMVVLAGARPAQAQGADAPPAFVYRAADSISGAIVTIYAPASGLVYSVEDLDVVVEKSVTNESSATTIRGADGELTLTLSATSVRLEGDSEPIVVRPGDRAGARQLAERLSRSRAIGDALDLLHRVSRVKTSPMASAVLGTRVVLMTLMGDGDDARRLGQATAAAHRRAQLRPVALQMTAGECWDEYAAEAIEIYMEYEDCVDNEEWWDAAGLASCLAIYEMRAIGAFAWWMSCVGLRK